MNVKMACIFVSVALCFSACSIGQTQSPSENHTPPAQFEETLPTEQSIPPTISGQTEPATVPATQPETLPPTPTGPDATSQPATQPSADATDPPATQPIQSLSSAAVITETIQEIAKLMPELKFDANLQPGTLVTITVPRVATHSDAVAELHDSLLSLFDYNLYLEQQIHPNQVQPVIFDYTYCIRYQGLDSEKGQHIFEVCYVMNKQSFVSDTFDSDEIIRRVTQAISESTRVNVTPFEDNRHTRIVVYDYIPPFYTTEQTVDMLVHAVENEIYSENIGIVRCTQFRLVFHSKSETAYAFLLYLR